MVHPLQSPRSMSARERFGVGRHLAPVRDRIWLDFDVVLHAPGAAANSHRLTGADIGPRKDDGALRWLCDPDGMPLQGFERFWQPGKYRIGACFLRQCNVKNPDLGWTLRSTGAAKSVGE